MSRCDSDTSDTVAIIKLEDLIRGLGDDGRDISAIGHFFEVGEWLIAFEGVENAFSNIPSITRRGINSCGLGDISEINYNSHGVAKIPQSVQNSLETDLPPQVEAQMRDMAARAFRSLGCDGMARADFFRRRI